MEQEPQLCLTLHLQAVEPCKPGWECLCHWGGCMEGDLPLRPRREQFITVISFISVIRAEDGLFVRAQRSTDSAHLLFPRTGRVVSLPNTLYFGVQVTPAVAWEICWVVFSAEWRISLQHTCWKPRALINSVLSGNSTGCEIPCPNNSSIRYTKVTLTSTWIYLRH